MGQKLLGSLTALCACMVFLCVGASAMEIYVTMPDTAVIELEVESGDSIDNVRDKLKAQDSRTAQWWLSYQDSYLSYGRTLADYNIQKESTLRLNASKEIQVSTKDQLLSGVVDGAVQVVMLTANIEIDKSLTVNRAVALDLNGHVLKYKGNTNGSVIKVASGGDLTIRDSAPTTTHYYSINPDTSLWTVLPDNTNAAGSIQGGIITGGTGTPAFGYYNGGGVYVAPGGTLTMDGGSIVGCSASTYTKSDLSFGGGVYLGSSTDSNVGTFTMNGGSIIGCIAGAGGGGVCVLSGCNFTMNTGASIRSCTAAMGGGVYNSMGIDDLLGTFTLNGGMIQSCKAIGRGGGGVSNSGEFIMQSGTIEGCTSVKIPNESNKNSGILNSGQFTMRGGAVADNVTNSGTINADSGKITGTVTNGIDNEPGKITGTNEAPSRTEFTNTVTNHDNSTISGFGTFTGEVINNGGTITGFGIFTGSVTNNGGKIAGFCDFDQATLSGYLTVTFDPDNGELNSTQQVPWVKEGAALTEPSPAPTKAGYTFKGWYRGNGWEKWDFDTDKVCCTMTLTAKWTANPSAPTYAVSAPTTENGKITVSLKNASRGDTVTITVEPDSGYVLETITVTDKDGNELELTDKGDGKYSFIMPSGKVEIKATFMEDNSLLSFFYDVPNDAYYYEAVKWAVENGITDGIGNSLFGPDLPCTRAQIVTFLWRVAGSPEPMGAGIFSDIPAGSYYAKAVAWAVENGVTTGTGEGMFSPDAVCTRAQTVTILARTLNAKAETETAFTDVPTDSYYADAVAWAAASGVTVGIGGGLFGSDNNCTRGQIVTFLYRAYNSP